MTSSVDTLMHERIEGRENTVNDRRACFTHCERREPKPFAALFANQSGNAVWFSFSTLIANTWADINSSNRDELSQTEEQAYG